MNIYSVIQIGDYHINHCEDYLITKKIGRDKIVCAVMDGCSTAMDSHFASTLVGKLIRKATIEKGYKELYEKDNNDDSIESDLKEIIQSVFKELSVVKNQLMLDEKELLTTLIILIYNEKDNEGIVLSIGDGVVCINGNITEFDRDNKPDYLAYHLNENFEDWYMSLQQKILFNELNDVSIATDGLLTFSKVKKTESQEKINFEDYLLIDQSYDDTEDMLNKKLKRLEHHYGVKPTDDLAIIRIIKKQD